MTTLTVHSIKGGSGKSLIAVLSAYELSKKGEKVLLIDGDYNAPCLDSFFPTKGNADPFTAYLVGNTELSHVISKTDSANLFVSHAPTPDFRQEIMRADVRTHGMYLKRILEGMDIAHNELGFDWVIFDNSSGISLPAINQLSCSNMSVIVLRPVRYGIESTHTHLDTIYRKLRYAGGSSPREDFLIWNQVPTTDGLVSDPRVTEYLEHWNARFEEAGIRCAATIPYLQEIVIAMMGHGSLEIPNLAKLVQEHLKPLIELLR